MKASSPLHADQCRSLHADFNLWLKSLTNANGDKIWSVSAINAIPIGGNAINVVFVWLWVNR
jgi:hypothetical protein